MSVFQQEAALVALVHLKIIKKSIKRVLHEHESDILDIINLIETKFCQLDKGQLVLSLINRFKSQFLNYLFKIINLIKNYIILLFLSVFFSYASILRINIFLSKSIITAKSIFLREFRELYIRRADLFKKKTVKTLDAILKNLNVLLLKLNIGQFLGARKLQSGDLVLIIDFLKIKKHVKIYKSE